MTSQQLPTTPLILLSNVGAVQSRLLNSVDSCVEESIRGFCAFNTGLKILKNHPNVVLREDFLKVKGEGKVLTLTGGGSGHEPAFMGMVGSGMMTGAVAGGLFSAPSHKSIYAAIKLLAMDNTAGIIMIFNNYTGDRLNFGLAIEKARCHGIRVEAIVCADDSASGCGGREERAFDTGSGGGGNSVVSIEIRVDSNNNNNNNYYNNNNIQNNNNTNNNNNGEGGGGGGVEVVCGNRRGLAGIMLVMKIVGFLSEAGEPIDKIVAIAKEALAQTASIGVSWSTCSLPGSAKLYNLEDNCMEFGLGIHGEAGIQRVEMMSTQDTISTILSHMTNKDNTPPFLILNPGDRVIVLLNNMGATTDIEMNIAALEILQQLENLFEVVIDRMFIGRFVTSQEMAGLSLTIMLSDDFRVYALDSDTTASAWRPGNRTYNSKPTSCTKDLMVEIEDDIENNNNSGIVDQTDDEMEFNAIGPAFSEDGQKLLLKILTSLSNSLIANATLLDSWDSGCGDGDCGQTFARGAKGLLKALGRGDFKNIESVSSVMDLLANIIEDSMTGTSAGIYSLILTSISQQMVEEPSYRPTNQAWLNSLKRAFDTVSKYGGAKPGDRTMIDPFNAVIRSIESSIFLETTLLWSQAAKASEAEMKATKTMIARAGKARNVDKRMQTNPDPGAKVVSIIFTTLSNVLNDNKKLFLK